jgi:hypothetical protein
MQTAGQRHTGQSAGSCGERASFVWFLLVAHVHMLSCRRSIFFPHPSSPLLGGTVVSGTRPSSAMSFDYLFDLNFELENTYGPQCCCYLCSLHAPCRDWSTNASTKGTNIFCFIAISSLSLFLEGGTNITLGSTPTRSKHMFGIWVASLNDEQRSIYI